MQTLHILQAQSYTLFGPSAVDMHTCSSKELHVISVHVCALWMYKMPSPYRQFIVFIFHLVIDVTFQLCRGKVRDEEAGCSALLWVLSGN